MERTGPEISGYFGSSFWSGPVLWSFLSDADTAVRKAMVAVGAAHRICELDITPRAFEFCELARSSYAKALRAFNNSLSHGITIHLMVVPLLLYVFELFQDNFETARTHMNGWLKNLFSLCLQKKSVSVERHYDPATDESINGLFQRLDEAITLLLPPSSHLSHVEDSPHWYGTRVQFVTLDEARNQLFSLIRKYIASCKPTVESKRKAREDYTIGLLSWSFKFAEYVKTMQRYSTLLTEKIAAALRIYRDIGCLLLLVHSHSDSDVRFERSQDVEVQAMYTIIAHFARMKDRIKHLTGSTDLYGNQGRRPSVVVDSGTFHPYLYKNRRLGSANLRHQLFSMMGKDLFCRLAWQNRGAYGVAEKIANVEESLVFALSVTKPQFQPIAVDIVLYMEERQLLRRHCVADPTDGALVWTQEWYIF